MFPANDRKSKRYPSVATASGIAILAAFAIGMAAGPASANWNDHRDDNRGGHHGNARHGWNGGYYAPPAVVYGGPYQNDYGYAPPPVVYAPGIGISLPGVSVGIR